MSKIAELHMAFERATKNTYVFIEVSPEEYALPTISTLYVRKPVFGATPPERIVVTVETA